MERARVEVKSASVRPRSGSKLGALRPMKLGGSGCKKGSMTKGQPWIVVTRKKFHEKMFCPPEFIDVHRRDKKRIFIDKFVQLISNTFRLHDIRRKQIISVVSRTIFAINFTFPQMQYFKRNEIAKTFYPPPPLSSPLFLLFFFPMIFFYKRKHI